MKISARELSFKYTGKPLFSNINLDLEGGDRPIMILGTSGSGKTTLLKLLGGLLEPSEGKVSYEGDDGKGSSEIAPNIAFMFQEPRLLPWLTVLENVSLPLEKIFGREKARERAAYFISLVSLEEKTRSFPRHLSGGEAQRVSMARAFAWPAPALFMDEAFQSLDIPLRISLMENCLSLLEKENRLLVAVTHDPREAVFMGGRVLILGRGSGGIVFDKNILLHDGFRKYGSAASRELEREMIGSLS
jgi:NitT/TauT family transport system ATP-binding protein